MSGAVRSVREATLADVSSVVALVESAYRGESSCRGWTTEAGLLDGQRTDELEIRDLITDANSQLLLAFDDARLVGSVLLRNQDGTGYVGMFAIAPEEQGRGLGKWLLERAEDVFRSRAVRFVTMTVIKQRSELIEWYGRRGYVATGRRLPFPYDDPRFGLPKRPDLEFVELKKDLGVGSS
ncbi:MAG: GNAT family N-acetyltransferase [Polyangiaceae bacterium]